MYTTSESKEMRLASSKYFSNEANCGEQHLSKLQVIKEYKKEYEVIWIHIPIERGKNKKQNFTLQKEKKNLEMRNLIRKFLVS